MSTTDTAATLKTLALLKNDGETEEIRSQAAARYAALKAELLAEAKKPRSWRAVAA